MLLEAALVERVVAKRAELRCQSPYSPDEAELSHHNINDQGEARILREFECRLRFALHLFDWICAGETIPDEMAVRIGCIRLVSGLQCGLQATAEQRKGRSNMPPPGKNRGRASEVHASFEPVEALLLDEIETELAEAQTRSVVAKACPHDPVHEAIGVARSVAVAMLSAQVRHSQ